MPQNCFPLLFHCFKKVIKMHHLLSKSNLHALFEMYSYTKQFSYTHIIYVAIFCASGNVFGERDMWTTLPSPKEAQKMKGGMDHIVF